MAEIQEDTSEKDIDISEKAPKLGGRPALFENVLKQTVDRFISSIEFSLFKKHYRTLYTQDRNGLRTIHRQFVKELKQKITSELQQNLAEQNLLELLKGLDDLIDKAKDRGDKHEAWRPSGNPTEDLKPHRIAVKMEAVRALEEMLQELQGEEEEVKADVARSQAKLVEVERQLDEKMLYFEKTAISCKLLLLEIKQYIDKANCKAVGNAHWL